VALLNNIAILHLKIPETLSDETEPSLPTDPWSFVQVLAWVVPGMSSSGVCRPWLNSEIAFSSICRST